jgi:hypothetical protein
MGGGGRTISIGAFSTLIAAAAVWEPVLSVFFDWQHVVVRL